MNFFRKILTVISYVIFFLGYFYIIFVNFLSAPVVSTRAAALKYLIMSFSVAVLLPGIICWQAHYIHKLEKLLEEMERLSSRIDKKNF